MFIFVYQMVHERKDTDKDDVVAIPAVAEPTETRISKNPSFPATISEASKVHPKPTETENGPGFDSSQKFRHRLKSRIQYRKMTYFKILYLTQKLASNTFSVTDFGPIHKTCFHLQNSDSLSALSQTILICSRYQKISRDQIYFKYTSFGLEDSISFNFDRAILILSLVRDGIINQNESLLDLTNSSIEIMNLIF